MSMLREIKLTGKIKLLSQSETDKTKFHDDDVESGTNYIYIKILDKLISM